MVESNNSFTITNSKLIMDISILKPILWQQFGAAVDMLENAIAACPEKLWDGESKFWHKAYHTVFFLDYYLCESPDNFMPPAPFSLSEFDAKGTMPERTFTQKELLIYLNFCRTVCHDTVNNLTEDKAVARWVNTRRDYPIIEILLYNMRHVQHHTAQLNLLLRQNGCTVPDWVSRTEVVL